jgi:hypothetical protein
MSQMSEVAMALGIQPRKLARILKKTKTRLPLSHVDLAVVMHYSRYGEIPQLVDDNDDGTEGFPVEYLHDPSKQPLLVAERYRREERLLALIRRSGLIVGASEAV